MRRTPLLAALLISASPLLMAQSTTPGQPPSPNVVKPGATTEGQEPSPNAIKPGATTRGQEPSPNAVGANAPNWYSHQANEIRASKLLGTAVRNDANESIGSINEIILGNDGKVAAVVLGVGGFLGMGEREVAMKYESLRFKNEDGKLVATANATKDSLKAAPEWTWAAESKRSNK
jgi:hypothetical protein